MQARGVHGELDIAACASLPFTVDSNTVISVSSCKLGSEGTLVVAVDVDVAVDAAVATESADPAGETLF